jgi:hypothetical protein
MRKISVLMGVVMAVLVGFGGTQASAQSGFYPIEEMGIFAPGDLEVDVDLSGAMLQVAAAAMENQDASIVELVANLERVRVQVGTPSTVDAAAVAQKMADAHTALSGAGWQKIVSVEEGSEKVYLYAIESAGNIAGLTALVNEGGEEVVVVNIVGDIDPQTLGRLLANLDDFDIEEIMGGFEQ